MDINLVGKQERALNVLKVRGVAMVHAWCVPFFSMTLFCLWCCFFKKSKLLEKISNSSEQDTGERLLNEYHINLKVLDQEIEKCVIKHIHVTVL